MFEILSYFYSVLLQLDSILGKKAHLFFNCHMYWYSLCKYVQMLSNNKWLGNQFTSSLISETERALLFCNSYMYNYCFSCSTLASFTWRMCCGPEWMWVGCASCPKVGTSPASLDCSPGAHRSSSPYTGLLLLGREQSCLLPDGHKRKWWGHGTSLICCVTNESYPGVMMTVLFYVT